jgi:hypothetical protein
VATTLRMLRGRLPWEQLEGAALEEARLQVGARAAACCGGRFGVLGSGRGGPLQADQHAGLKKRCFELRDAFFHWPNQHSS